MSFWETVLGHHLAEVLIRCLPQIAEKAQEEKQYTVRCGEETFEETINNEISKGGRYINHQSIGTEFVLVFAKIVNE